MDALDAATRCAVAAPRDAAGTHLSPQPGRPRPGQAIRVACQFAARPWCVAAGASADGAAKDLSELYRLSNKGKVTLLFASRNGEHNNATVLKELMEGARKPPTGTGPAAAGSGRIRKAARGPKK